jgi:hypothetical protein
MTTAVEAPVPAAIDLEPSAMLRAHEVCGALMERIPEDVHIYQWRITDRLVAGQYSGRGGDDQTRADIRAVAERLGMTYREVPGASFIVVEAVAEGDGLEVRIWSHVRPAPELCTVPGAGAPIDEIAELERTPPAAVAVDGQGVEYAARPAPAGRSAPVPTAEQLHRAAAAKAHQACGKTIALLGGTGVCRWEIEPGEVDGQFDRQWPVDACRARDAIAGIAETLGFEFRPRLLEGSSDRELLIEAVGDVDGVEVRIWDLVGVACSCDRPEHVFAAGADAAVSS